MCPKCNRPNPPAAARCCWCPYEFGHRDCYPDQYRHPLVGKRVKVRTRTSHETEGVVERVVQTRFGPLAHLEGGGDTAWLVSDCTPVG
jgi:hypothetical protein